nr:preprotein translocase subunit SecE [Pseudoclavibacter sp. Marseille-Q3772]
MATGKSGEDRDGIESRVDDATASTESTGDGGESTSGGSTSTDEAVVRDTDAVDESAADADETDADGDTTASAAKVKKKSERKRDAKSAKSKTAKKGKKTPKRNEAETLAASRESKGIGAFFGQVVEELKKVVTPTGKELWRYVAVVLSFLLLMMLLVMVLDWAFGFISSWVFGEGTHLFPQEPPAPPTPAPTPDAPVPTP